MKKISFLVLIAMLVNLFSVCAFAKNDENIKIESLFFYDEFGNVCLNAGENEKSLMPCVVISKDTGNISLDNLKIAAAVYEKDGSLKDISLFSVNSESLLHGEKIYGFDRRTLTGDKLVFPKDGYAKAYLFESYPNIKPYTECAVQVLSADTVQPVGKLKLDVDTDHFSKLIDGRFEIRKENGVRKYSHNATYDKLFDTSGATNVYLTSSTTAEQYPVYRYGYGYDNSAKVGKLDGSASGGSCFQGPLWYFQYTKSIASTESVTYENLVAEADTVALRWKIALGGGNYPGFRNFAGLWGKGTAGDTVLSFKAPYSGTVKITGSPSALSASDTKGLMFRISKNDNTEVIFPKTMREGIDTASGWSYYNASVENASAACDVNCTAEVEKGDYIRFIITGNGKGGDIKWSPKIEYTSITGEIPDTYTEYDDDALVSQTAENTFYAPYDAKKTNDLNVVTIPVTDVSDGQSVSVTVSDESVLEYIGGNKFKVKGVSVSPVTVNVKITENGEEISSKDITVRCVNIMALTSTAAAETGSGLEKDKPINAYAFAKNITDGVYKDKNGENQKNFIVSIVDDVYSGDSDCSITVGTSNSLNGINLPYNINCVIRNDSPSGFTWIGRFLKQSEYKSDWESNGGVYQRSININGDVSPVNICDTDSYGMPRGYTLKKSLDECKSQKGSYYQDGYTVYANPFDGENFENLKLLLADNVLVRVNGYARWLGKLVFENIGFMPGALNTANDQIIYGADHSGTTFAFFGCKFFKGKNCAVSIAARYNAFLFDCVSAYASTDGFNYHSNNDTENKIASSVVEVNCISYNNGSFNQLAGSTDKNNSNNSSTAHDSMYVLRVGGKYWNSQGGIAADAGGTKSITIGCEVYGIATDTLNQPAAYLFYDTTSASDTNNLHWENPPKYVIDCLATGTFVRNSVVGTQNTYVLDLCGFQRTVLINTTNQYDMKTLSWSEVIEADE
mgnify:FL=1